VLIRSYPKRANGPSYIHSQVESHRPLIGATEGALPALAALLSLPPAGANTLPNRKTHRARPPRATPRNFTTPVTPSTRRSDPNRPPMHLGAAMQKLRIGPFGISGGRWLTPPLRDARRFPSTRWYPVPGTQTPTRTPLGFGICPSFKGHFLSRRAKP
jgi:hypothetical protein